MSRNKEKAKSILHQLEDKRALDLGYINFNKLQRPKNVSKITDLKTAEKWRAQVNSEINSKILKLYDELISDYQIRDLNDEVNKLFREKTAWEYRVKELGGPNYLVQRSGDKDGFMIKNYRYFGRAKELKEVKQLMELQKLQQEEKKSKVTEEELFNKKTVFEKQNILDEEYYGLIKNDNDVDLEFRISEMFSQELANQYEKADKLNDYKDHDKSKEAFFKVLESEDVESCPDLQQVEEYIVMKKKKIMLESLDL